MVRVFLQKEQRRVEMEHQGSARSLLDALGVNPQSVLIVMDGVLITEDDVVDGAREIELLSVVSGG